VAKRLPIKLKKEPLIDAACELRITSASPVDLHTVLPGILFGQLNGIAKVEQLPAMFFPEDFRANAALGQLNSQLVRIHWDGYFITIGKRNVVVGPRLPYRGWADYKARIEQVFLAVCDMPIVESIERYSIKYTNLLPVVGTAQQAAKLQWGITIGPLQVKQQPTQLRVENVDGGYLTIIQMSTGAVVDMIETKETREGCVVDVDTLCQQPGVTVAAFKTELSKRLEDIRLYNKVVFFDCLRDETIDEMEPIYE
jgi:uncharacterized protein (TIGR04255 family)